MQKLHHLQEAVSTFREPNDRTAPFTMGYPALAFRNHWNRLRRPSDCKKGGHTRKPVLVKAYLAIFVCFATKAVHLEVVEDLYTEDVLSTLKRFIARRGLPFQLYTDNGRNIVGAKNDLSLQSPAIYSHTELNGSPFLSVPHSLVDCGKPPLNPLSTI